MGTDPIIAVTIGDPAGIGPEVTAKALKHEETWAGCRPLVIGDARVMQRAAELAGGGLTFRAISEPRQARYDPRSPDVLDLANVDLDAFEPGRVSAAMGRAAVDYIEKAVALVQSGEVDALATGPINKAAINAAGVPFIGHTELLADMLGEPKVTTMLATE
ncbi:MAG: 4-hydroxythreonine-4-phosphate dehydrogenase PdxA, partial [Chloroflexi bacterium]|nr:4-hydroxythreonine-4-phosphate dehydrogenase PdxA [Chloroflexota bacterium]